MNAIVDNRGRQVGNFLRAAVGGGARLSVVSAYFTIYAYEALRRELEGAGGVRFLYGEPRGVGAVDPADAEPRAFRFNDDGGMELKQALVQRPLARACAKWIERLVEIRTVRKADFLHGKMYHVAPRGGGASAALLGSSNFTRRGLGFGARPNLELNLELAAAADRDALLRWFDDLWRDDETTRDAKAEVLAALERLGMAYAPQFVYYKTLFHVFAERLAEREARERAMGGIRLEDTEIWKRLYEFQRDGVKSVIARLTRHNGCILADSVGLGKTWTALAAVKFFELRNEKVLVLCPKKLEENWSRYLFSARNNPLAKDRLNYTIMAHTDLSRYTGKKGAVSLDTFNWGAFDLVIIDESHNFRNEGRDRKDDDGNIVRRSRYNRLLEEVVKDGARTKVLMLSATPVNTSLRDLRNQIYLMTEKRHDAFLDALGIGDIQNLFGVAQRRFLEWETKRRAGAGATKAELFETLGADFHAVLDAVTVSRSRRHLERHYPGLAAKIGGFPERAKPVNLHPPTDRLGALSYDDLHGRIGKFRLALYRPSDYLIDESRLAEEKGASPFDQRQREGFLVGMIRVNLLKRLESSVHAFALTARRILDKIADIEARIEAWRERGASGAIEARPDDDEEDEDFAVGRAVRYRFDELDIERWRVDLTADREIFRDLLDRAGQIDPERDAKLGKLLALLTGKHEKPTCDRDGRPNRKVLVFTAFADTARYLYDNILEHCAGGANSAHAALVTGSGDNRNTLGPTRTTDILAGFAPRAQETPLGGAGIDILVATDCLSEGQNLQDCDLVVNYDIHWNPVRLMQRFGRIDRLGSRNIRVAMANFWPTEDLERYLDLKVRVEARMALADAAATGTDDLLDDTATENELAFRDDQLKRLRDDIIDIEDMEDGVTLADFTLDDFIVELLRYIETNREALEGAPFGIYAVVEPRGQAPVPPRPGAIFCLRQKRAGAGRAPNLLHPWFLVYVHDDGTVRCTFRQAGLCLALFRALAADREEASAALEDAFADETGNGARMGKYETMLAAALKSIAVSFRSAELSALQASRDAMIAKRGDRPESASDFELVTWLVIAKPRP